MAAAFAKGRPVLFGWPLEPEGFEALLKRLEEPCPEGSGPQTLVTMNLDHVVRLRRDPKFREAYAVARSVTLDGFPVWAYARLKGLNVERCPGSDLFAALFTRFDPERHRPFFLVGREEVGAELIRKLAERGFRGEAAHHAALQGFDGAAPSGDLAVAAIRRHRPTHVVVGLGAPKSEIFLNLRGPEFGDVHALAVGSAPDFVAGLARRAPPALRGVGLEWAWRLVLEPRRLARRYLVDAWGFLPAVLEDLRRDPPAARRRTSDALRAS